MFANLVLKDALYFRAKSHETALQDFCTLKDNREKSGGGGCMMAPPVFLGLKVLQRYFEKYCSHIILKS